MFQYRRSTTSLTRKSKAIRYSFRQEHLILLCLASVACCNIFAAYLLAQNMTIRQNSAAMIRERMTWQKLLLEGELIVVNSRMFYLCKSAVTTKGSTHPICSDWLGVCEVDLPTSTSSIERDWSLVWLTTYENALSVVECTVLSLVAIHTSRSIMLSLYVFLYWFALLLMRQIQSQSASSAMSWK